MKGMAVRMVVLLGFAFGCAGLNRNATGDPKERIGVYDSRAVAVAYGGSEMFEQKLKKAQAELEPAREAAKKAGDTQKAEEIEAPFKEGQYQLHLQVFSTAPVDDILAQIKDKLPEIEKKAGVSLLVSKWDQEKLAQYKTAERVDITAALIDAFHPHEKSRKWAADIQKHKPMDLEKAKRYFKEHPQE